MCNRLAGRRGPDKEDDERSREDPIKKKEGRFPRK